MKIAQELAAPVAVFEAIHELEFDQTANLTARTGHDRLGHDAGVDTEPAPNCCLIRHWGGNPALKRWHMRRSADWCGSGAGVVRRVVWAAKSVLQALCIFRLVRASNLC